VVCALSGVLSSSSALHAQTATDGSIRGYVKDEHAGVVPGVSITAVSDALSLKRAVSSDSEGFYRLLSLPPGVYTIVAEAEGFARFVREGIGVRAGLNLGVDIILKTGTLSETVNVHADTPLIETTAAGQTVNISGDFQRQLPVNTRKHWSDFLFVTPGAVGNQVPSRTADSYTLRGSDFASHVIQLDGADMASAQQNATTYVHFPTEVIEDVQVKTAGVDASAPIGVGAVINIATRSGTNALHGSAGFVHQRREWNGDNSPGGTSAALAEFLPEVAIGGPLKKDRLWYFGAYRAERIRSGISRGASQLTLLRALKPDFEPFDSETTGQHVFAKVSGRAALNHQFLASYQYDPQTQESAASFEAEQFVDSRIGGSVAALARLSSVWSQSLITRINVSYNNKALYISGRPEATSRPVHAGVFTSAGRPTGTGIVAILDNANAGWSFDQPYYKFTISADAMYHKPGWWGSHDFQAGIYFQPRNHQETIQKLANGGFSREENVLRDPANPAAGIVPFWREIYDVEQHVQALIDSRDFALYVQDAWSVHPQLSLNAGVRLDFIERTDRIFDLAVQKSTAIGPRFGLNYMLDRDRTHALRASWVRVHDVLSINPASAGTSVAGKRDLYDTDLDGTFETVFITPPSTVLAANRVIDPDRGQPYINEFIAGYMRQLPGTTRLDASFVRREYRDRTALVEVNGIYDDGVFRGFRDERMNEIYLLTSNRWNWQVYNGFELQGTRQTSRAQLLASYTRAWWHFAGDWQPNDPAAFIQPHAFPNDRGIGSVRTSTSVPSDANSLSGNHMIENGSWRKHSLRLGVSYRTPWDFLIASSYSAQSGAYTGPIVTRRAEPDPRFGPPTVTLSNGRVVANPLATVIRFAFPTRGEGQSQTAPLHIWNLRVGRDIRIRSNRLELAVDIFNVTNEGADQAFNVAGANQLFSSNYRTTTSRQLPRSARVSARFVF
jgi:hypothetical protein